MPGEVSESRARLPVEGTLATLSCCEDSGSSHVWGRVGREQVTVPRACIPQASWTPAARAPPPYRRMPAAGILPPPSHRWNPRKDFCGSAGVTCLPWGQSSWPLGKLYLKGLISTCFSPFAQIPYRRNRGRHRCDRRAPHVHAFAPTRLALSVRGKEDRGLGPRRGARSRSRGFQGSRKQKEGKGTARTLAHCADAPSMLWSLPSSCCRPLPQPRSQKALRLPPGPESQVGRG